MGIMSKLFGTHSDHELKRIYPIVNKIEALEPQMQALTDEELRAKTTEFKERYKAGEDLDDLLPEAFAAVREAAWRVLGMKPFRVQLIGGIVLHQGRIAEMKTGEGKTLRSCAARVPERDSGRGRAHCHRQRLPGPPRQRMDGQGAPFHGPHRGPHCPRPEPRKSAARPTTQI